MKVKKIPKDEFARIYARVPRLCVDLVIVNEEGAVLLTKRDIPPDKGWWHFPGGTVLMWEKLKETAVRVAREELNCEIEIIKLIDVFEYAKGSGLGYPISAAFMVEPLGEIKGGEQARTVKYFKKLPEKTLPEVRDFLRKNYFFGRKS